MLSDLTGAAAEGGAEGAADPPKDASAGEADGGGGGGAPGAERDVELDVYPAAAFLAVQRESGAPAGARGAKGGGHGHGRAAPSSLQHLSLTAVASVPGAPVAAPGVQLPDGYTLQLVDFAVRTKLRGRAALEDGDGTERRLVRLILAQTSDAAAAAAAAETGAGLTVGEYDAETLREIEEAEAAAAAAASAEEYAADRDELLEMFSAAKLEQETLLQRGAALQKQLSAVFIGRLNEEAQAKAAEAAAKAAEAGPARGAAAVAELEHNKKYRALLDALALERARVAEEAERADAAAAALQHRLDEKEARVGQVTRALSSFKLEVAKQSIDGQSGKPMPRDLIAQYERRDAAAAADVARVQLKNLFVQGQIEKLEALLAKREQLADGLALVDFEQLKIENSTLVEKIDDRNEEIAKLRKKTTTAVQMLTHMREKLHFVSADVARLSVDLAAIERSVSEQREKLGQGKKAREHTRAETEVARHQQGFAYVDALAIDFEVRKRTVLEKKGELAARLREYDDLVAVTQQLEAHHGGR